MTTKSETSSVGFAGLIDRLRIARRDHIPEVRQLTATDCGAACLAMVLGYHGRHIRLDEIREVLVPTRDGVTARSIVDAAYHFGLRGRGVRADIDDLPCLAKGSILHWNFSHFVVFEKLHDDGVFIIDPGFGRRMVPISEFRRSYTGVALLLETTDRFEKRARTASSLQRYLTQLLSYRQHWTRIITLSFILQLFALALPVLTGLLVDRVVPRSDYHLLTVIATGLTVTILFNFLNTLVRSHLLLELRTYFDLRLSMGFVDHLVELPFAFFQLRRTGDLMMRLSSSAAIRDLLTTGALSAILDGTLVLFYLIILIVASPALALVTTCIGALQIAVHVIQRRRLRELISRNLEVQARTESYEAEMLHGMETLKAMGAERRAAENWTTLFIESLNVGLDRGRLTNLSEAVLGTLRSSSPLVILTMGTLLVLRGDFSLGSMLALNALATGFLAPLGNVVSTATQMQQLDGYIERLDDVFRADPEQEAGVVRRTVSLTGRICVEEVSFRYSPLAPWAVRDANLKIELGMFVAIVGRTGCGKSTLASLILGLHRPTAGRILYDGTDLRELDLREVRRQVGVVTQHPHLFAGTVRSNIALGDPSLPLSGVVDAAKAACIHDDIETMPMGYETPLADGGGLISGGQRQRIALARALATRPRLILLDEATSALDPLTEDAVYTELARLGCTRIVIAHRLSTIAVADLVLVMDAGAIVERGRHEELMRIDSLYRRLVTAKDGVG